MDLFSKTKGLGLVKVLREAQMYPFFRTIEGSRGSNVMFQGKELVMMGSNNYLGLTHDPRVMEASVKAIHDWGTGCTGSRFLNGNLSLHEELEKELAEFYGTEGALVFASGFMANQGAISALVGPDDHIFSDSENHACIIEGCQLTRSRVHVYKHSDMEDLERQLQAVPLEAGKLIITDGVFSMTGSIARYDRIYELAQKYKARTYLDDAHALGVIGKGGRGTADYFNLPADIVMGTFSKSLASQGGFICAQADVLDWIRHKARTFMFSAALAPASVAAALCSLRILKSDATLVEKSRANAAFLKSKLESLGLNTLGTQTSVIPIFIGDDETALIACQQLLKMGIFTTPVPYPAVPRGHALIRCSVMATHTERDLELAVAAFEKLTPMILKANQNPSRVALADGLDASPEIEQDLRNRVGKREPAASL